MKIILLGDIHANLPALEAVLLHGRQRGGEQVWNTGDFVGYGAFPEQVVLRLQAENALSVIGNYDLKMLNYPKFALSGALPRHPEKALAFRWAYENLSEQSRLYLSSLPERRVLQIESVIFLLTHGSPDSIDEMVEQKTLTSRLRELAVLANEHTARELEGAQVNAVLMGHTHRLLWRKELGIDWINPGSVGRLDDGDPRASYALLDVVQRAINVQHFRVEYDLDRAVAAIRENNLPEGFAQMMLQGRELKKIIRRMHFE